MATLSSIANRISGERLYRILRDSLRVDWRDYAALVPLASGDGPFGVLVAIILSQNTNDKNAIAAYNRLRRKVGLEPSRIIEAGVERIADAIRSSGMYRQKARAIVEAARLVEELGGEEKLMEIDPGELARLLTGIKGIGRKTVDVFLSVVRGVQVFAVDTHAMRIAMRWGLIDKPRYEAASRRLAELFKGVDLGEAHRLIIALGRTYCTARRPRCRECPLAEVCPYPRRASQSAPREGSRG